SAPARSSSTPASGSWSPPTESSAAAWHAWGMTSTPVALTIAGSEATGGAGAQVDLKTFQQHGVFGCVALTCIVSFDPKNDWNHRFVPVDPQVIADQLEVITTAYPAEQLDVVKIGMLGTPITIQTV